MKRLTKAILLIALAAVLVASLVACGKCNHTYNDGVCTKCNTPCVHNYQNGACVVCNKVCTTHNWVDGVCTICSKACNHAYDNGCCSICNATCNHNYTNGVCDVCGRVCATHNWVEGVCSVCAKQCNHAYVNGTCTVCTARCNHTYTNGVCTNCNVQCIHNWQEGVCNVCTKVCQHSFSQGACSTCSLPCTHSFSQGCCTICQLPCTHNYVDGSCSVCLQACRHNFSSGVCQSCGTICNHVYEDSACKFCDVVCTNHYWAGGICAICTKVCSHTYKDGVCTNCNYYCAHFYVSGVCNYCGKKDPSYIPPDSSMAKYKPIVDCYKSLIDYKRSTTQMPPRGDNEPYYYDAVYKAVTCYDPTDDFGYAIKDVNSDGTDELLLMDNKCSLYCMFTLEQNVPTLVANFQDGMGYVTPWGEVFYNEKIVDGNNYYNVKHVKRLVGTILVGLEYLWLDTDGDLNTNDDMSYFHATDGTRVQIDKAQYDQYTNKYEYYWSYPSRLTRLTGLWYKSALTSPSSSIPTADFSDYQAVIDTFTLMYSKVANGKFDRTKWTGGTYDTLMAFDTEADYLVFNKIVAACVLVQSSSTAKFGYALKDLNKDGIDELVLMESKGYLLAIFTQKDGKAVLLDSYTDTRTAFIDANGLIHVQTRLLPGNSKDALYSLCTIADGKLVTTLEVGALYVKSGYSNIEDSWFKVVDTQRAAITKDEYTTLYAQWAGDLGTTKFYTYTLNNAGLTFVQLQA